MVRDYERTMQRALRDLGKEAVEKDSAPQLRKAIEAGAEGVAKQLRRRTSRATRRTLVQQPAARTFQTAMRRRGTSDRPPRTRPRLSKRKCERGAM